MQCNEIQTRLADYSVGAVNRWQRWRIGRHVARCANCRTELTVLERTGKLVATLELESAPESTWPAVQRRIESPASTRTRATQTWKRLATMAALVMVLVIMAVIARWPVGPQPATTPVAKADADMQMAEEGHLSAGWSAPLSDPAAMGLRLEALEDNS